jgi:hypothetical protein
LIVGKSGNVVLVEVDEKYHGKQINEDNDREKIAKKLLTATYKIPEDKVHVVRISPMENNPKHAMLKKETGKIIIKNSNYDDVMDVANVKISKRLLGNSSPLTPGSNSRKINPKTYQNYKIPGEYYGKKMFNTILEDTSVKSLKFSTDFKNSRTFKKTYVEIKKTSNEINKIIKPESPKASSPVKISPSRKNILSPLRETLFASRFSKILDLKSPR